jgi:hypothetical protein
MRHDQRSLAGVKGSSTTFQFSSSENREFEASLGYLTRLLQKQNETKQTNKKTRLIYMHFKALHDQQPNDLKIIQCFFMVSSNIKSYSKMNVSYSLVYLKFF